LPSRFTGTGIFCRKLNHHANGYVRKTALNLGITFAGKRVARRIYAETAAKSSRRDESDLFQISDAPVVELVQAT